MKWSYENILNFIELYRANALLWDPRNPKYYNKIAKADAWEKIAQAMGTSADESRKKMCSLLSSFRREKAKIRRSVESGKGGEEIYESSWFAYKSLTFTLDRNKTKALGINEENEQEDKEEDLSSVFERTQNLTCTAPNTQMKGSEQDDGVMDKSLRDINEDEAKDSIRNKIKENCTKHDNEITTNRIIQNEGKSGLTYNSSSSVDDECYSYGTFIGNKLRNYSSRTRSSVQHAISNIIFNADQGHFNQASQLHSSLDSNNISYETFSSNSKMLHSPAAFSNDLAQKN